MLEESALLKRRQTYRRTIRREELEEYFHTRRQQLIREYEVLRNVEQGQLTSDEERNVFLEEGARRLSNSEPAEWGGVVEWLQAGLPHFEGDYHQWFNKSVIQLLTSALTLENLPLGIEAPILKLFTNLIITTKDQS